MASGLFGGGNGTTLNPYLIEDAQDLNNVRNNLTASYKLVKDIDLNVNPYNTGIGWVGIGKSTSVLFSGVLDGNGYIIDNLYINSGLQYQGLFSYFQGVVTNLGLTNVQILKAYHNTGALIGYSTSSTAKVDRCYAKGNISLQNYCSAVGGLIGQGNSLLVSNCYSDVNIAKASLGGSAGGLIGNFYTGIVENCFSKGNIESESAVGGLISNVYNNATIRDSYSETNVVATNSVVGGLIACINNGISVVNCYAIGKVTCTGASTGGLIGISTTSTVTNSYWNTETSTKIVSAGGVGLTTVQMKTVSNYDGWNANIWMITSGKYPRLFYQTINKYLIKNHNNNIFKISAGVLVDLGVIPLTESIFITQGMSSIVSLTEQMLTQVGSCKVVKWTDSGVTNQTSGLQGVYKDKLFKLIPNCKLKMWTDDTSITSAKLNIATNPYRPIDKLGNDFKILMYKE